MNVWTGFSIAIRALAANKLRTALTVLGMVIGVAAVVALMSLGSGMQQQVEENIRGIGTNLLFINPGTQQQMGGAIRDISAVRASLTLEDAQAIEDAGIPGVVAVAPSRSEPGSLVSSAASLRTQVNGVTPAYARVRQFSPAEGEFFSDRQLESYSRVIALGHKVALDLFPDGDAVGSRLRVNNNQFTVVAVMEEKGQTDILNRDNMALVPLTTLQRRLSGFRTSQGAVTVSQISVELVDERAETIQAATQGIGALLRERHRVSDDDFTVGSQKDFIAAFTQITAIMTIFLGSIAGISLLVGGIGIMNIMLVSVTERTREIGIRKAVGARRRDILRQFLFEAITVSLGGGVVGLLAGSGLAVAVSRIQIGTTPLRTVISPQAVVLAVGVSVAIGLFFGIYPATRAARLNPIEALRYE